MAATATAAEHKVAEKITPPGQPTVFLRYRFTGSDGKYRIVKEYWLRDGKGGESYTNVSKSLARRFHSEAEVSEAVDKLNSGELKELPTVRVARTAMTPEERKARDKALRAKRSAELKAKLAKLDELLAKQAAS